MKTLFILIFLASYNVNAIVNNDLSNYLQKQIVNNSLGQNGDEENVHYNLNNSEVEDLFYLNTFILRFRGNLSFKIPGLLGLSVIPETEIVWQRINPEGYETYKK